MMEFGQWLLQHKGKNTPFGHLCAEFDPIGNETIDDVLHDMLCHEPCTEAIATFRRAVNKYLKEVI